MADNTTGSRYEDLRGEINTSQNEPQNGINDRVNKETPKKIEEIRNKAVEEMLKESENKELTPEQNAEIEEKIRPEVEKEYEDAKNFILSKTEERKEKLNSCQDKIDKFKNDLTEELEKLESEISDLKNELNNIDKEKSPKEYADKEAELKEKESDYNTKKEYLDKISDKGGLESKLHSAFATQQVVVDQGILGLKKCFNDYPYINVDADRNFVGGVDERGKDIEGILLDKDTGEYRDIGSKLREQVQMDENQLEKKKKELEDLEPNTPEYNKKQKEIDDLEKKLEKNNELLGYAPEPKQHELSEEQQVGENNAFYAGQGGPTQQGGAPTQNFAGGNQTVPAYGAVGGAGVAVEPEQKIDYAALLGLNSNAKPKEKARIVLDNFLNNKEITNDMRLDMLKDGDIASDIKTAIGDFNGKKDDKFLSRIRNVFKDRKIDKDLRKMIDETLPEFADKKEFNSEDIELVSKRLAKLGFADIDIKGDLGKQLDEMIKNDKEGKRIKNFEKLINEDDNLRNVLSDRYAAYAFKNDGNAILNREEGKISLLPQRSRVTSEEQQKDSLTSQLKDGVVSPEQQIENYVAREKQGEISVGDKEIEPEEYEELS